jgi:aspartate carbamoyltransferase catalytic subunit
MSFLGRHFIDFDGKTSKDIYSLFEIAEKLKPYSRKHPKNTCLMFLEPSTRTQLSFDLAIKDCGTQTSLFLKDSSSMQKGETFLDTLLNLQALGFDLFVIRHGQSNENLGNLAKNISVPIVNAGEGVSGHPTQALLDCYTIFKERKNIQGEKVLFVGDIRHSRVVSSNLALMKLLGIETAFCAPKEFLPNNPQAKTFQNLKDGLAWATVVMALRTQLERHGGDIDAQTFKMDFIQNYSLTEEKMKSFKKDGIIMHPGPFHRDHEIASQVVHDKRSVIFKQVENGRKVRRALVHSILGEDR